MIFSWLSMTDYRVGCSFNFGGFSWLNIVFNYLADYWGVGCLSTLLVFSWLTIGLAVNKIYWFLLGFLVDYCV